MSKLITVCPELILDLEDSVSNEAYCFAENSQHHDDSESLVDTLVDCYLEGAKSGYETARYEIATALLETGMSIDDISKIFSCDVHYAEQ